MEMNVRGGELSVSTKTNAALSPQQRAFFSAGFSNTTIYSCQLHNTLRNNDDGTTSNSTVTTATLALTGTNHSLFSPTS